MDWRVQALENEENFVKSIRGGRATRLAMVSSLAGTFLLAAAAPAAAVAGPPPSTNPPLADHCGQKIAVVFDVSSSIQPDQFTLMTDAGQSLVDVLAGTPSSMAIYTFALAAPAKVDGVDVPENQALTLVNMADPAGIGILQSRIDGLVQPGHGEDDGTNWDRGLAQTLETESGETYDTVVLLTDGEPTRYGAGLGPGWTFDDATVSAATVSANALKEQGTRVVAISVQDNMQESRLANLAAISGTTADSDYFLTSFALLGRNLRAAVSESCYGTLSISKFVQDVDGERTLASGWEFGVPRSEDATIVTGPSGAVAAKIPHLELGPVSVHAEEKQRTGFSLRPVDGSNATCIVDGEPIASTSDGDNGFSVPVGARQIVACAVVNQQLDVRDPTPPLRDETPPLRDETPSLGDEVPSRLVDESVVLPTERHTQLLASDALASTGSNVTLLVGGSCVLLVGGGAAMLMHQISKRRRT